MGKLSEPGDIEIGEEELKFFCEEPGSTELNDPSGEEF